jgi:hypothetical protein
MINKIYEEKTIPILITLTLFIFYIGKTILNFKVFSSNDT